MPSEPPVVSDQTLILYRAGAKQRVESFLGEVADSPARTAVAALVAGVVAGLGTLALTVLLQRITPRLATFAELLDAGIAGALAAALVWVLFDIARTRRKRLMAYVNQVAELNHHVRNALQVIRFQAAVSKDEAEAVARINDAVARIDEALRSMYPLLHEPEHPSRPPAQRGRD